MARNFINTIQGLFFLLKPDWFISDIFRDDSSWGTSTMCPYYVILGQFLSFLVQSLLLYISWSWEYASKLSTWKSSNTLMFYKECSIPRDLKTTKFSRAPFFGKATGHERGFRVNCEGRGSRKVKGKHWAQPSDAGWIPRAWQGCGEGQGEGAQGCRYQALWGPWSLQAKGRDSNVIVRPAGEVSMPTGTVTP